MDDEEGADADDDDVDEDAADDAVRRSGSVYRYATSPASASRSSKI